MGIESTSTFIVRCDACPKTLDQRTKPQKFKSDGDAAKAASRAGWHITSTSVQCPTCKFYPLPEEAK